MGETTTVHRILTVATCKTGNMARQHNTFLGNGWDRDDNGSESCPTAGSCTSSVENVQHR